jgi:hypothetical protein
MRKFIIPAPTIAVLAVPAISMASGYVPHNRVTSLTASTTYDGTSYVHAYTLTRGKNHSFTGTASAGVATPRETVSGTLHHSKIYISGTYPNGYRWSYDGPIAGGTGSDSLGMKRNIAFTTTKSLVTPMTVKGHDVNNNDSEWGPDSCLGLRG